MKNNWVAFYMEFADKLLEFKSDRSELIDAKNSIQKLLPLSEPVAV